MDLTIRYRIIVQRKEIINEGNMSSTTSFVLSLHIVIMAGEHTAAKRNTAHVLAHVLISNANHEQVF